MRARGSAPVIEILQPRVDSGTKLKSPFPINIRFRPADQAAIEPSTFRVLYGALGLDITSRITKHAQVTPQGLQFDHAQIPAGKHKLVLQVQDDKQRTGERELRFEVE